MRSRLLHRDFWVSEDVADMSFFERLLFQALWGMADREGLLLYKPRRIAAEAFSYDSIKPKEIDKAIKNLEAIGVIEISTASNNVDTLIYIPKFNEFQHIHQNEAKSKLQCIYITGNVTKCSPVSASVSASDTASVGDLDSCPTSGEVTPDDSKFHLKAFDMANLLAKLMVENNQNVKLPSTNKQRDNWLLAIDRLNRIDGYAWDEIRDTIKWCQGDDFWKSNILSGATLRKQFDKLVLAKARVCGGGRFNNQQNLLETLEELNDGKPEESTCWDSPCIQRADDAGEDRRLLGGA